MSNNNNKLLVKIKTIYGEELVTQEFYKDKLYIYTNSGIIPKYEISEYAVIGEIIS